MFWAPCFAWDAVHQMQEDGNDYKAYKAIDTQVAGKASKEQGAATEQRGSTKTARLASVPEGE